MSKRFYNGIRRTEPDMRAEFNAMMDGRFPEIAKAQTFVLRKMVRTATDSADAESIKYHARKQIPDYFIPEEGYLISCECIDKTTKEPDIDNWCPICNGEGFIWEEVFINGFKAVAAPDRTLSLKETSTSAGLTNIPLVVFYTRSSVPITKADKVVEIWVDSEGEVIRPYRRKSLYRIGTAVDYRSDNGRIEYWKIDVYEEKRKYLNGPNIG